MKLSVVDLGNKTIHVEVDPDATITELKGIVRAKTGEKDDFVLQFGGESLLEGQTLRDYSIQGDGQKLTMAVAVEGGA